eukprot:563064-Karenia_brevis.AAC.1
MNPEVVLPVPGGPIIGRSRWVVKISNTGRFLTSKVLGKSTEEASHKSSAILCDKELASFSSDVHCLPNTA